MSPSLRLKNGNPGLKSGLNGNVVVIYARGCLASRLYRWPPPETKPCRRALVARKRRIIQLCRDWQLHLCWHWARL